MRHPVSRRHVGAEARDTQGMTTPAPRQPKRRIDPAFVVVMIIVVVIILAGAVAGWLSGREEPSSEEQLCSLLKGGWTSDQLVGNDQWKDWPDSQSPLSRTIDLVDAANRGGCFELA